MIDSELNSQIDRSGSDLGAACVRRMAAKLLSSSIRELIL